MKKRSSFFLCFLILLAFAGFVFYTGWTQFKVSPGDVGIVVSKTSGVNPTPVTHNKFSWAWEFLLPTNASIAAFSLKAEHFEKRVQGALPSAKEYAQVFNGGADFSYSLSFLIDARSSVQGIAALLKDGQIKGQDDLRLLLERSADSFCARAAQKILAAALSDGGADFEAAQKIAGEAAREFSASQDGLVQIAAVSLSGYSVPDFALYKRARESYEEYARALALAASEAAQKEAEENSRFKATIQKMESLGETLKKYPELSDMIKNSDNINKTLQTIDSIE